MPARRTADPSDDARRTADHAKTCGDTGRTEQPQIRQRLLDACTDHVLQHGVPDRLAPLAAAAGTSAQMLPYHSTTKDDLLREVLREARARQRRDFGELLRPRPEEPCPATLRRAWPGMSDGPAHRCVAVFNPRREGLDAMGSPELATVVLAVIRGLLTGLEATGDRARADQAWQHFVDLLASVVTLVTGNSQRCNERAAKAHLRDRGR